MTREDLGINDWLELIKEDKNLNGAYISIAQYIYLIEKENQELKKQLEEKENQQKEFINYINAYIELFKDIPDLVEEGQKDILEEILSKYKEIIGGKDE